MDGRIDRRDLRLLEADRYTFAVLRRILKGPCDLVLTDHERLILCHSEARYPVWVWTPDDAGPDELARAWALVNEVRPAAEGWRYNVKVPLAEAAVRGGAAGCPMAVETRLFAYDCPAPRAPARPADGEAQLCGMDELEDAAALYRGFYGEIGERGMDAAYCRTRAAESIGSGTFFLWKDALRRAVACCGFRPDGDLACLGPVYTRPEFRRRHYAQSLVFHVTCRTAAQGLTPMLYTDAEYPASNACYTGIGYVPRGRLCTIGMLQNQEPAHP